MLGQGVDLGGREPQGLGHDAHRRAGAHGVDVGHHSHVLVSESLVDVLYHLVPARRTEVHVDVGHLAAVGIEKPLEQQIVADRLRRRYVQRVADDGVAGRPAAAARHPFGACPPDDVVHHQEIMGESHLLDHAELLLQKLHRPRGHGLVAPGDAPEAALGQERVGRLAGGQRRPGGSGRCRGRGLRCSAGRWPTWRRAATSPGRRPPSRPALPAPSQPVSRSTLYATYVALQYSCIRP